VAEPVLSIGDVSLCAICGATLLVEPDGTARRARFTDIGHLSAHDWDRLRTARGPLKKTRPPVIANG
jgi:hypothetical protein